MISCFVLIKILPVVNFFLSLSLSCIPLSVEYLIFYDHEPGENQQKDL